MKTAQGKPKSMNISAGLVSAAIAFALGTCAAIALVHLSAAYLGSGEAQREIPSFVIAPLFALLCGYVALFDIIRFGKR
jgi:ABC-type nitrate/sulfonate/bicarbonate transport system permease component